MHGLAQQRLPEISLATVHPNLGDPHQHLICVRCNDLLDVKPQGESSRGLSPEEGHGYEILDVKLLFRGVCPNCLEGALPA